MDKSKTKIRNMNIKNILLSQIRISRNIKPYPFLENMDNEAKQTLVRNILNILEKNNYPYEVLISDNLKQDKDYYYIFYGITNKPDVVVVHLLNSDIMILFNNVDHINIISYTIDVQMNKKIYHDMEKIESLISKTFTYYASIKYGFLSPDIYNTGLGMKVSAIIHAPGIANMSDKNFVSDMNDRGYDISRLTMKDKKDCNLILVSSSLNFGISEKNLIDRFLQGLLSILDIDNRELIKYYNNNKSLIDDTILRSLGALKFCKTVDIDEAIISLSDIFTGLRLQVLKNTCEQSIDYSTLFASIFNHNIISKYDEGDISAQRATIIKEFADNIEESI